MNIDATHLFALYCENLASLLGSKEIGSLLTLDEPTLIHRIMHVLRLRQGQKCILFDRTTHILCSLDNLHGKKSLQVVVEEVHTTKAFTPSITLLLPLLKKEAFETALYNAVELGASEIIVVTTEKSRAQFQGTHELERNIKIMVAAAEQAKYFNFPSLSLPIPLEHALKNLPTQMTGVVCTPEGKNFFTVVKHMLALPTLPPIFLALGPEGDFTLHEYKLLADHHFIPCALTPTILRSPQALATALGALRSCLRVP